MARLDRLSVIKFIRELLGVDKNDFAFQIDARIQARWIRQGYARLIVPAVVVSDVLCNACPLILEIGSAMFRQAASDH